MAWVAGVDGCRAGWFVVLAEYDRGAGREEHQICTSFREVLDLKPKPSITAVDIPIGLLAEPSVPDTGVQDRDFEQDGLKAHARQFDPRPLYDPALPAHKRFDESRLAEELGRALTIR